MPSTLAIDFGSKYIGLALVRNEEDGRNTPLFAGTLKYDKFFLNKKVQPRAAIRRVRRTRKAKKTRLNRLYTAFLALRLPREQIPPIIRFCARRGYKSLWETDEKSGGESNGNDNILYHYGREEFFAALKTKLEDSLSEENARDSLSACEQILNCHGDPKLEIRPVRIENRGVSRCAWDGCNKVTPRLSNALQDPLAHVVFTVYKERIAKEPQLQAAIEAMLDRVADLGKRYHSVSGADPAAEQKVLMKRIRAEFAILKRWLAASPDNEDQVSKWKYIKINLKSLITRQEGRNRFCREHSAEYVQHLLAGKPIQFKETLIERDIASRSEEILFQKLWRYIEARLLSLVPNHIDRIVVERTAFDLLTGTQKQRQKMTEKAFEEMYQRGPRYGYTNDLEMLKKEFAGLCAYCGRLSGRLTEREHILPQKDFFFDSYVNIVPACETCNSSLKGKLSGGAVGLRIHDAAYEAYSGYLRSKFKTNPPHIYQRIKKGILNLMRQPDRVWEAENYLALISNQLADTVQAQRTPLPLARYIGGKLRKVQVQSPKIEFRSGRHTEIWRRALYPEFDKLRDSEEGGLLNYALAALIMASDLPSVSALKARHLRLKDWNEWKANVLTRAPSAASSGIPHIKLPFTPVPGFEEIIPGNYLILDLALFNWNCKDRGTHKQNPFGWCGPMNCPSKRKNAAELVAEFSRIDNILETADIKREKAYKLINLVAHPNLRAHLFKAVNCETPGKAAVEALMEWLRVSVKNTLPHSPMSNHPGDRARHYDLCKFSEGGAVPSVIGIRRLFPDRAGNVDLCRAGGKNDGITHRYQTDPSNIGYVLAYASKKGIVDRKNPIILEIRQSGELRIRLGKKYFSESGEEPLLRGRILGQGNGIDSNKWSQALKTKLARNGLVEYGIVTPGCVLKYFDNEEFFLRNFSHDYGFKNSILKNVVGIKRTPFDHKFRNLISLS
jgi:hypothetical protein